MLIPVKTLDADVRVQEMVRLLGERKRLLESEEWIAHEDAHREKGGEASLQLFSDSPDDRDVLQQPAGPVPSKVYDEGQFPVGGCECGFVMARDNKGQLHTWQGNREDEKNIKYKLNRPTYNESETETKGGYGSHSSTTISYGGREKLYK